VRTLRPDERARGSRLAYPDNCPVGRAAKPFSGSHVYPHVRTSRASFCLALASAAALSLTISPAPLRAQEPAPAATPAPAAPPIPPPITVKRLSSPIELDGALDDAAWQDAAVVDQFFETFPGDNTEPAAKTIVYLGYDDKYFYMGVHAYDPQPDKIRAPYVERDSVIGTDDNLAVFLDTRNDRRSAIELRVNPRGDQGDAIYDDGTGNEDFSFDTFYDTAAKLTSDGWTAEYRIPFSSLRYSRDKEVKWGILVWRNYPRDQRYGYHSSPIPRGSNCWICRSREINGLVDLPAGGHYVAAPYATGRRVDEPSGPLGTSLDDTTNDYDIGGDVKWTPSASNALDATINPDFSQIESDVGQIPTNSRFALFFPEKRPFFLEGLDLFDTPIQAVYTRNINDPAWGARDTGKFGGSSFTALLTDDDGGGGVIIPGPTGSDLGFADFRAKNFIGRLRHDFGGSFAGLVATAREIEDKDGGGYNRVFGPDFNYRWSGVDQLTGQFLYSKTETTNRPDLGVSEWDGRELSDHAAMLEWLHTARDWTWRLTARDYGDDFRADLGFLPQVGIRLGRFALFRNYYPEHGALRRVQPYVVLRYIEDQHGNEVERLTIPAIQVQGTHNLFTYLELSINEHQQVNGKLLEYSHINTFLQVDPGRRLSRVGYFISLGEALDNILGRKGHGGEINPFFTWKPTDHLVLDFTADRQWVDLDEAGAKGRLFTAQIERLKATYNFNARSFVRLIGEYFDQNRDPALYAPLVLREHAGSFSGSALFAYRLNWQTVFFLGYGDDRRQDLQGDLQKADRAVFLKISYAFQG
jgi:uncharacterized protein DUF5916/cellulose/xylan binding protein with CBM9 domain